MYKYLFIFFGIFTVACSSENSQKEAASKPLSTEEAVLYQAWRTGQFYYNVKPFGLFLVNRYDTLQEEFIRDNGMLTEFDIAWMNDSTYTLSFHQVTSNPAEITLPEGIDTLVRTCTMTQVSDTVYVEKAYSNMSNSYIYTQYRRPKSADTTSTSL